MVLFADLAVLRYRSRRITSPLRTPTEPGQVTSGDIRGSPPTSAVLEVVPATHAGANTHEDQ
jgi:hypothetical protein